MNSAPFNVEAWRQALEKYGAVTRLTVTVYSSDGSVVCGPVPSTPLFELLNGRPHAQEMLAECARQCLAQRTSRPAIVVAPSYGLAVVGVSLVLDGVVMGAAVAGYALIDFVQPATIAGLARKTGIPFKTLWSVALQQPPVSQRRLVVHGELLQVLGDTILKENYRTQQFEETAERLELEVKAKDEFLAVLSHELRTPLTPILGWLAILKRIGDDPVKRQGALDSIERNMHQEAKLIDELLDLNYIIREKMTLELSTEELSAAVKTALESIAESAAAMNIDVQFVPASEPLPVEVDADRLQQIFGNVLSNSLKFTPSGGRVQVAVERKGADAVVRVRDSGEGIAPEFLPYVFDMFRQQEQGTRRRHSGLGIGLALVKRLLELQGGTVDVTSAGVGRGTEVTITLPLALRAESVGLPTPPVVQGRSLDGVTILLIEDSPDSREVMRLLLEEYGAKVLEAHDGEQALDVLAEHRPDVVLCDLRMPVMDGFEFMRALRPRKDQPPVVAISGFASQADRRRTRAAGFSGHLTKPLDVATLVSVVHDAVEHATASH